MTAQDHWLARLDDKRFYLALEWLLGARTEAHEEAMFNVGFERGYMQCRRDTLAVLWRRTPRARLLATPSPSLSSVRYPAQCVTPTAVVLAENRAGTLTLRASLRPIGSFRHQ